jgi:hypothetical protein
VTRSTGKGHGRPPGQKNKPNLSAGRTPIEHYYILKIIIIVFNINYVVYKVIKDNIYKNKMDQT